MYNPAIHLTEESFNLKYRQVTEKDFNVGGQYFRKERWFERYYVTPVFLSKQLLAAAQQFSDDSLHGNAYVERTTVPANKEITPSEKPTPAVTTQEEVKAPVPLKDQAPPEPEKKEAPAKKKAETK